MLPSASANTVLLEELVCSSMTSRYSLRLRGLGAHVGLRQGLDAALPSAGPTPTCRPASRTIGTAMRAIDGEVLLRHARGGLVRHAIDLASSSPALRRRNL